MTLCVRNVAETFLHIILFKVGEGLYFRCNCTHIDGQGFLGVQVFNDKLQRAAGVQLVEVHERVCHALEEGFTLLFCKQFQCYL